LTFHQFVAKKRVQERESSRERSRERVQEGESSRINRPLQLDLVEELVGELEILLRWFLCCGGGKRRGKRGNQSRSGGLRRVWIRGLLFRRIHEG